MRYYFKFYNEDNSNNSHYIYNTNTISYYNINLNYFDLKIYSDDIKIDYSNITNYKLVLEREVNGIYITESIYEGTKTNNLISFNNCLLNKNFIKNSNLKYRCYLIFYEGGIVVYSENKNPIILYLKTVCDDFNISIDNSIYINGSYELQDKNVEKISFEIEVESENENNTLQYYYEINSEESVEPKNFSIFGYKKRKFEYMIVNNIFYNESTTIHFFMKDTFNNIRYKKFNIITKNNANEMLEIIDYTSNIIDENTDLTFFYTSKNIEMITPKITVEYDYSETYTQTSSLNIGLRSNYKSFITFKLNDHFEDIIDKFNNSKSIKISFAINGKTKESNSVKMIYDNEIPRVIYNNMEDNYLCIKDDESKHQLSGVLIDDNILYIGENKKKYDFIDVGYHVFIKSNENIVYLKEDDIYKKIQKYNNYYVANISSDNFTLHDENYNEINNFEYITDIPDNRCKIFFMAINYDEFNTYEKNILQNNELMIKEEETSYILKQEKILIDNYLLFKIQINEDVESILNFDIGIEDFDYSFLKYLNRKYISANTNHLKNINLDFYFTRLLFFTNNSAIKISKIKENYVTETKESLLFENFSLMFISLKDEFFSSETDIYFTDNNLNLKPIENIYGSPVITVDGIQKKYYNYNLTKIDEKNFKFEFEIDVEEGLNDYSIKFIDMLGNTKEDILQIEKQSNPIKLSIDQNYSSDIIFVENEEYIKLVTNKDSIMLKIIIENETLYDKQKNNYIVIDGSQNKYKIIRNEKMSYTMIELYNLKGNEEYNLYYNDLNSSSLLTIKTEVIDKITIESENNITTGNDSYYLKFSINDFATPVLSWDNKEVFNCEFFEENGNKYIKIQKNKNDKIMEKINIILSAYDKKNIFTSVSKNISVNFYNDLLISEFWIPSEYIYEEQYLLKPYFDLYIKVNNKEYIKTLYLYDESELDFYKRKKIATLVDENLYIIKNIISPIIPTSLNIVLELKTDEEIKMNKILFENNMISLYDDINDISIDYISNTGEIIAKLKNHLTSSSYFNSFEVYANNELLGKINDIKIEGNEEIDIKVQNDKFFGKTVFDAKLIKLDNSVLPLETSYIFINNDIPEIIVKNNFNKYNLISNKEIILTLDGVKSNYNNYIKITNEYGIEKKFEIYNGDNYITLDDNGVYLLEIFSEYYSNIKKINFFYFILMDDYRKYINIKNAGFEKYNFINELIIENKLKIDKDILQPKIIFYNNDIKMKEYTYFKNTENNFYFSLNKSSGNNKYVYKDNFLEFEILNFDISNYNNIIPYIRFHTNNKTLFECHENEIILNTMQNLYFNSNGIKYIDIYSINSNKIFKKTVLDNQENIIFSSFIPCFIKCYDKNNIEIKDCQYNIKIKDRS